MSHHPHHWLFTFLYIFLLVSYFCPTSCQKISSSLAKSSLTDDVGVRVLYSENSVVVCVTKTKRRSKHKLVTLCSLMRALSTKYKVKYKTEFSLSMLRNEVMLLMAIKVLKRHVFRKPFARILR